MKLAIAITPKNGCLGIRLIIYHYWLHLIACDFLVLYYGILKWISSIGSRAIHMRHFCNLYAVYTRRCNTLCTLLHISQSRYLTANIQCTICLYMFGTSDLLMSVVVPACSSCVLLYIGKRKQLVDIPSKFELYVYVFSYM